MIERRRVAHLPAGLSMPLLELLPLHLACGDCQLTQPLHSEGGGGGAIPFPTQGGWSSTLAARSTRLRSRHPPSTSRGFAMLNSPPFASAPSTRLPPSSPSSCWLSRSRAREQARQKARGGTLSKKRCISRERGGVEKREEGGSALLGRGWEESKGEGQGRRVRGEGTGRRTKEAESERAGK